MRRRRPPEFDGPGQDSFLDIVANLVGILVILVMVIGVRAKDAWVAAKASDAEPPTAAVALPDVETPKSIAQHVTLDIERITDETSAVGREISVRFQQRNQLQTLAMAAEQSLSARRSQLDETQRQQFDLVSQIAEARRSLSDLVRGKQAIEAATARPAVITHLPTPLAKTVFGGEEHFRLARGRLTHVPMNEFVEKLQREAPQKVWKLKDTESITETIGPVAGFRLRYTLRRAEYTVTTRVGPVLQRRIELDRFVLVPESDELGEPLEVALQTGSDFHARLQRIDPQDTTITVWTYPDSFDEFRRLKLELYQSGYLTAARPLPEGQPISGSPRGTRSAAQ